MKIIYILDICTTYKKQSLPNIAVLFDSTWHLHIGIYFCINETQKTKPNISKQNKKKQALKFLKASQLSKHDSLAEID